jgi:peroxiredoxin Q/BCP
LSLTTEGRPTTDLQEGDPAPDFTVPDDEGNPFQLSQAFADSNVVLYFYPKDFTPGCIAESQEFRDEAEAFLGLDAKVVGVSTGTVRSKAAFKKKYGLNFRLLADTGRQACTLYGTLGLLGTSPKRVTFVIARGGRIVKVHRSPMPGSHIEAARAALFMLRERAQAAAPG